MKTKEILYDEIITEYNGELFKQGEIVYRDMQREDIPGLTEVKVNFRIAAMRESCDDFAKELTELVQKYSV